MALGKKIGSTIKDIIDPNAKKKKGSGFLNGLKEWITSPGGIVTVLLIIGAVWYCTSHKGKGAAK